MTRLRGFAVARREDRNIDVISVHMKFLCIFTLGMRIFCSCCERMNFSSHGLRLHD